MANHRYTLRREWNSNIRGIVNWVMLNPSTADDVFDDATIRRVIGFSKRWGYSGLVVTNLFAFRATDPRELVKLAQSNPGLAIGEYNDHNIIQAACNADTIVCAWGNGGKLRNRDIEVTTLLHQYHLYCIRLTDLKCPAHPVRERYTDSPVKYLSVPVPQ